METMLVILAALVVLTEPLVLVGAFAGLLVMTKSLIVMAAVIHGKHVRRVPITSGKQARHSE